VLAPDDSGGGWNPFSGSIDGTVADESGRKPTLSGPQEKALAALLGGSTVTAAADAAGVTRQTVSEWIHRDPAFIADLQNARATAWAVVEAKTEAAMVEAADVLVALLRDPDPRVRLAAASRLLSPLFRHPDDRAMPRETTPEAVTKDRERTRRQALRTEALLDSLA
jgi:hypothetical protein